VQPRLLLLLFPFGAFLQLDQFKLRHSLPTYVAKSIPCWSCSKFTSRYWPGF
jgi:hypothetical protein